MLRNFYDDNVKDKLNNSIPNASFNAKNSKWNEQKGESENNHEKIKYMLNTYRVLLTRARKGMVICIPKGNGNITPIGYYEDKTRLPEFYDGTYEYLKSLGIEEI